MTLVRANLINSISLLAVGFGVTWLFNRQQPLFQLFLCVVCIGAPFYYNIYSNRQKYVLPISFALTVLILVALTGMRLPKSLDAGGIGLIRVLIMIATGFLSTGYYVKHFFRSK